MKIFKRILWIFGIFAALCLLTVSFLWQYLPRADFGTPANGRAAILEAAAAQLDAEEGSDAHKAIINIYNAHEPLAQGYKVTYEDNWCATFVSFCAIESGLTEIIPTECSCERQIGLWQELDRWEESDSYLPLPGDIIYYDWDFSRKPDCIGWPEHVGIVVGTCGPFIRVMEGNKDGLAAYRTIWRNDWCIRGYGLPDYVSK